MPPGLCGCCGERRRTFCIVDLRVEDPIVGAVVDVYSGATLEGSCTTTGPGGCCTISGLSSGTYTITVTSGSQSFSVGLAVTAGNTYTIQATCCINICVLNCNGTPYTCMATVTVKNATTGATVGKRDDGRDHRLRDDHDDPGGSVAADRRQPGCHRRDQPQ